MSLLKCFKVKYFTLIFLLFLKISFLEAATPISDCGFAIDTPGYYYLTKNITLNENNTYFGKCIIIATNNVIIDGKGFSIINNISDPSLLVVGISYDPGKIYYYDFNINNITIVNLNFYNFDSDFEEAILISVETYYRNATMSNILISNISLYNSKITLYISEFYLDYALMENVTISNISVSGIYGQYAIRIAGHNLIKRNIIFSDFDLSGVSYIIDLGAVTNVYSMENVTFKNFRVSSSGYTIFLSCYKAKNIVFENFSILGWSVRVINVFCSSISDFKFKNFLINGSTNVFLIQYRLVNSTFENFYISNSREVFWIYGLVSSKMYNFTILNTKYNYFSEINESSISNIIIYNSSDLFNISRMINSNFSDIYMERSNNIFYSQWITYFKNNIFYNVTIKNSSYFINYYGETCYDWSYNKFTRFYVENSNNIVYLYASCDYFDYYTIENITIFNSFRVFNVVGTTVNSIRPFVRNWQTRNIYIYNSRYSSPVIYIAAGGGVSSNIIENIYIFNSSMAMRFSGWSFWSNTLKNIVLNLTGDRAIEISTENNEYNSFLNITINNCNGSTGCIVLGYSSVDYNNFSDIYIYNSRNIILLRGSGTCRPFKNNFSNIFIYNSSSAIIISGYSTVESACNNTLSNIYIYNSPKAIEIIDRNSYPTSRNSFSYIYIYDSSLEYSIVFGTHPHNTTFNCVIPHTKINISINLRDENGFLNWNDSSGNIYRCFNKLVEYKKDSLSVKNFYPRINSTNWINIISFFSNLIEDIYISKNPLSFNETVTLSIKINESTLRNLFSLGFTNIPIFIISNDTSNFPASNFTLIILSPLNLVVISNESSIELKPKENRTVNITVITNYETNNIKLSCENLPIGVYCLFSEDLIPYNSSSLLTIISDAKLQPGKYKITVIARDLEKYVWNFTEILVLVPEIPQIVSVAIRQYILIRDQEFLVESPIKVFTISKFRIEIINNGTVDLSNLELNIFNSRNSIFFNYESRMLEKHEKIFINYLETGKSRYIDFYVIPARFGSDHFNLNLYQENKLLISKDYIFEYFKPHETIIISEKINIILIIITVLLILAFIF